jgi:iron complex transport system permease protein
MKTNMAGYGGRQATPGRMHTGRRTGIALLALGSLLVISVIVSLSYGKGIDAVLTGFGSADGFGLVLRKIRLPRTIVALLVGGALGVCGVTLQSVLRNPLAEPYTLGISGGASLGIALSAILGAPRLLGIAANPVMGFVGAMLSASIVYVLSKKKSFQPSSMILFGIVVSLVFSSFVFFLFSLMDPDRMQIALMWLMGDLSSLDIAFVPYYIPMLLVPSCLLFLFGKELDILSFGYEKAQYLGIDPPRIYGKLFLLASLLTGLCVSAAGIIGFVGLIVPHMLRQTVGSGHRVLLIASYLGGAFFLVTSDIFSRYLLYPVELPVGVVTGILGGAVLLVLLVRKT